MGELTGLRVPSGTVSEVRFESLDHLLSACAHIVDRRDSPTGAVTPSVDPFALRNKTYLLLRGRSVHARALTLAEIILGFPPIGAVDSVDPLLVAEGEVLEGLLSPEKFIKPDSEWDDFKPARVHANDDEWDPIGSVFCLIVESLWRSIRVRSTHPWGAFGVEKSGTPLAPATRVLRLITKAIPTT